MITTLSGFTIEHQSTPPICTPASESGGLGKGTGHYTYKVQYHTHFGGTLLSNASVRELTYSGSMLVTIPTHPNPNIQMRSIWRTISGGALCYKLVTITNNTTKTWLDKVSDATLLQDRMPEPVVNSADAKQAIAGHLIMSSPQCFSHDDNIEVLHNKTVFFKQYNRVVTVPAADNIAKLPPVLPELNGRFIEVKNNSLLPILICPQQSEKINAVSNQSVRLPAGGIIKFIQDNTGWVIY